MSAPSEPTVLFESEDHLAVVTLNRPHARNAISRQLEQELYDALERIDAEPDIWVGIIAARGEVFCAGADLKERNREAAQGYRPPPLQRESVVSRPHVKTLIAAVDGPAFGGGLELMLACDLVVASTNASFALPEVKWSQIASGGGLFRLPRVMPRRIALEMALTASAMDSARAHTLGLVNELCAPGQALDAARAFAARILANGPLAVQLSRTVMESTAHADDDACWRITRDAAARLHASEDSIEGPRAFGEKRPPRWLAR